MRVRMDAEGAVEAVALVEADGDLGDVDDVDVGPLVFFRCVSMGRSRRWPSLVFATSNLPSSRFETYHEAPPCFSLFQRNERVRGL